MSLEASELIIVTPVYEDVAASTKLFQKIAQCCGQKVYVVAVDDGSVHHPLDPTGMEKAGLEGVVLRLIRNVGHQRAIAIGLSYVADRVQEHHRVIIMDSDGEDLPETISQLLADLKHTEVDIVVAHRKSRVESLKFKVFYQIYKRFFNLMTGKAISFGNFMALKPHSIKRLVAMHELPIHIAAAVITSKLRTHLCPLDRGPRYAGQSKMNFVGLALHGFKGLMVFAEDVLVRVGIASVLIASLAILGSLAAVTLKLIGYSTPGWFSVALGILFLMLLQTGALALMTLMLTGVVRSGSVAKSIDYHDFVERTIESRTQTH